MRFNFASDVTASLSTRMHRVVLSPPVWEDKASYSQVPCASNLIQWQRVDAFGNGWLRAVLVYRWNAFALIRRLLAAAGSRPINCMAGERQFRIYDHLARHAGLIPLVEFSSRAGGSRDTRRVHGLNTSTDTAARCDWDGGACMLIPLTWRHKVGEMTPPTPTNPSSSPN